MNDMIHMISKSSDDLWPWLTNLYPQHGDQTRGFFLDFPWGLQHKKRFPLGLNWLNPKSEIHHTSEWFHLASAIWKSRPTQQNLAMKNVFENQENGNQIATKKQCKCWGIPSRLTCYISTMKGTEATNTRREWLQPKQQILETSKQEATRGFAVQGCRTRESI